MLLTLITINDILNATQKQLKHGKYPKSTLVGDGSAGKQIGDIVTVDLSIDKVITYIQ